MSIVVSVPTPRLLEDLHPLPEGVEVLVWDFTAPAPVDRIDIVVPPYMNGTARLGLLEGVEVGLVQSQSIGYDGVVDNLPDGLRYANAASVHETATAEMAIALALAGQRRFPEFFAAQQRGDWSTLFAPGLADRRVLLLGFGGVGKATAARLAPFEVELTVIAQRARTESVAGLGDISVHGIDELAELIPDAEIVIITLPGSNQTRHLFDDAMLARMSDDALLVNVGRGPVVDTDALVRHAGRLRAALDVVDPEPLPADHPLWTAPGVFVAPHTGGASSAMFPRTARLVRTQIERMLRGEEPLNVVLGG